MTQALVLVVMLAAAPKVAAPEWNAVNVKREMALFYADTAAEALRREGLSVVTSQDIGTLLGMERQKQLMGCDDAAQSCLAELASALGCEATLVVNLARFDDGGFRGLAKLLSSRDGTVLSSVTLDASSERGLLEAIEAAGAALAAPLLPKVTRPVTAAPPGWWWVPGAVGVAAAGGGAALLVAAQATYQRLPQAPTRAAAEDLAAEGEGAQATGWVLVGAGAAALATSTALLLWPREAKVTASAAVTPSGASLVVGGTF